MEEQFLEDAGITLTGLVIEDVGPGSEPRRVHCVDFHAVKSLEEEILNKQERKLKQEMHEKGIPLSKHIGPKCSKG